MLGLGLQLLDQRLGLGAGELAGRLPLVEPHRPAGIAKVGVPRFEEEGEQLLHLLGGGGRTRGLTEDIPQCGRGV